MSLIIKNEETCDLARELADLTGESVTSAITIALRQRIRHEWRQRSAEERLDAIHAIQERIAPHIRPGPSAVEHGDYLYDERGLPK